MSSEAQLQALYEMISRMTSDLQIRYALKQLLWQAYYIGYTESHTEDVQEGNSDDHQTA